MDPSSSWPWLLSVLGFGTGFAAAVATARRRRHRAHPAAVGAPSPRQTTAQGVLQVTFANPISWRQPLAELVDAVLTTGCVSACNQRGATMRRHSAPEELIGKRLDELLLAKDYRNRIAIEQMACQGGRIANTLTHGLKGDGTDLLCLDDWQGEMRDGCLVSLRITQREINRPTIELAQARSELRLREALAAARLGTWRWEIRRDVVTWSPSTYGVFGVTPGSFRGTLAAFLDLVHPDDRVAVKRRLEATIAGDHEPYVDQFRVRGDDGNVQWLEGRGRIEQEDDGPCLTGTVMDVTASRHAEQELRDSEVRFANLAEAAFECIAVTANGRFLDVNRRFVETFLFPRDQLIGRPVMLLVHPDDQEMVANRIRLGQQERYEHRARRADGSTLIVEVQARDLPFGGVAGRVTSLRDITEQKKQEAQLVRIAEGVSPRTGEAFFRSLVENLALVLRADHVFIADTTAAGPGEVQTLAMYADGRIAPNLTFSVHDTPCAEAMRQDLCIVEQGVRTKFPRDVRLVTMGVEGFVGAALRDANGRIAGMLVVMFRRAVEEPTQVASTLRIFAMRVAAELTRRRYEAELRDSETRLRATIENTPNVAVQWYDGTGRVLFWNKASENMFGWTAEEAIGRTLDQLIHTEAEAHEFAVNLHRIGDSGLTIGPVECRFRHKDGSVGVCLSTLFGIPGGSDRRTFVCMDVDVTAQKRADKRREELAHHLIDAQEAERRRLAGELHDSLGQSLSMIKNRAHLARIRSGNGANTELDAIDRLVSDSLAEVRSLVHNLRPVQVEMAGLTKALQSLVDEVAAATPIGFQCRLENVDDVVGIDEATHVYRIVQEALHNLVKHSRATTARIKLERDLRSVRLHIDDDGVGFVAADRRGRGLGLDSMVERANMLGGVLTMDSRLGDGTSLYLELPVREPSVSGIEERGSAS